MMPPNSRTDPYAAQLSSPLFRLPRELRDDIYAYYASEENGYFHHFSTNKLYLADRQPIDLRLMYTCRAVAQEMKGVALRTNAVTFMTSDIEDVEGFHGLHSRAGRLKKVLDAITRTRRRMLLYAADCVTPTMLQSAIAKYGDGGRLLVEAYNRVQTGRDSPRYENGLSLLDAWHVNHQIDPSTQYQEALRYILELASADPRFKNLALRAFDFVPATGLAWSRSAISAAYLKALNWQPAPWEIPNEAEIVLLEQAFSHAEESSELELIEEYTYLAQFKWFFSATAIAINYLEHHPQQRRLVRRIALQEDRISVSNPEAHMCGFAHICHENPSLHIVRHVGLWSSMYPFGWASMLGVPPTIARDHESLETTVGTRAPLFTLINWISAETIAHAHLPNKVFSLVLEGYTSDVWDLVKEAVLLNAVMTAFYKRRQLDPPQYFHHLDSMWDPYSLPCHIPEPFAVVMKDVLERKATFIAFDLGSEQVWNYETLLQTHLDWSPDACYTAWKTLLRRHIPLPGHNELSIAQRYWARM